MSNVIDSLRQENCRTDLPEFNIGDTIRCQMKITEGGKTRIQNYEGVVMAQRGTCSEETITVRKISNGVPVERVIPLQSPSLNGVEVIRFGRVRRAKLYYLRALTGRKARIRERRMVKK